MARPAKAAAARVGHADKKEISRRTAAEEKLKNGEISVPVGLTAKQRKIAETIIDGLEKSRILCSLDDYILEQTVIAIDKLHEINMLLNKEPEAMLDSKVLSAKERLEKTFFRGCNELCLSPQSRAKIAAANASAADDSINAIKAILAGKTDDEEE